MDRIVDAFVSRLAPRLNRRLKSGCRVERIVMGDPDVEVHWISEDDGPGGNSFDFVICAVPAPATMRIHIDPDLPANKRAAPHLLYVSAGKTLMHCSMRHWESQDGIFGGNSVTDLPHQQSWYPSDNAMPLFAPDEDPGDEYGSPMVRCLR